MSTEDEPPLLSYDDYVRLGLPGEVIDGHLYLGGRRVKDWRKLLDLLVDDEP